jgi:hypothetical protein
VSTSSSASSAAAAAALSSSASDLFGGTSFLERPSASLLGVTASPTASLGLAPFPMSLSLHHAHAGLDASPLMRSTLPSGLTVRLLLLFSFFFFSRPFHVNV